MRLIYTDDIRAAVRRLWDTGMDTADIAKVLKMPQHQAERVLHEVLDIKNGVRVLLRDSLRAMP